MIMILRNNLLTVRRLIIDILTHWNYVDEAGDYYVDESGNFYVDEGGH